MATAITGLHHITLCASGAQEDIDFEDKRQEIVAMLEPIVVPEANRPVGVRAAAAAPSRDATSSATGAAASRRTSATFIGSDRN